MNLSHLLVENSDLRASVFENFFQEEPRLYTPREFSTTFDSLFDSAKTIERTLNRPTDSGRTVAQRLAEVLDNDSQRAMINPDHMFYVNGNYAYYKNIGEIEINESNAQDILGSLFRTIDTLIQAQNTDSHIGSNAKIRSINNQKLEKLVKQFDDMVENILDNVAPNTLKAINRSIQSAAKIFFEPGSVSGPVEGMVNSKQIQKQTKAA